MSEVMSDWVRVEVRVVACSTSPAAAGSHPDRRGTSGRLAPAAQIAKAARTGERGRGGRGRQVPPAVPDGWETEGRKPGRERSGGCGDRSAERCAGRTEEALEADHHCRGAQAEKDVQGECRGRAAVGGDTEERQADVGGPLAHEHRRECGRSGRGTRVEPGGEQVSAAHPRRPGIARHRRGQQQTHTDRGRRCAGQRDDQQAPAREGGRALVGGQRRTAPRPLTPRPRASQIRRIGAVWHLAARPNTGRVTAAARMGGSCGCRGR